jgi:hypothetical protein
VNAKLSKRLEELERLADRHRARQEQRAKDAERFAAIFLKLSDEERTEMEKILACGKEIADRLGLPERRSPEDEYRMIKQIPFDMRLRYLEMIRKYQNDPED